MNSKTAPRSNSFWRSYYLLRYHRPWQLAKRVARIAWNRSGLAAARAAKLSASSDTCTIRTSPALKAIGDHRRRSSAFFATGGDWSDGSFSFLNQSRQLGRPPNWSVPDCDSLLWKFHLHYHEFVMPWQNAPPSDEVWQIVLDWIQRYPPTARNLQEGWHPFCISRRLPSWYVLWNSSPLPEAESMISRSLLCQTRILVENLETDLGGNHLLENLRAVSYSAFRLDHQESRHWRRLVIDLLDSELSRQVLEHGEHFERAPTYHLHMLDALLDIVELSQSAGDDEMSDVCRPYIKRMRRFAMAIRHSDGHLPLFSDGSLIPASCVEAALQRAGEDSQVDDGPSEGAQQVGQYWCVRAPNSSLVFDANAAASDHLPGHAHCDLLNLELSIANHPVIVDSGTYDYEDSPMRAHCRSTAAHNVLQVDGVDQLDFWSSFRIGYRGSAREFRTGTAECDAGKIEWAQASHDAYRRIGIPKTYRWLAAIEDEAWICLDWICPVNSPGRSLTTRLHFHPGIPVERTDQRWTFPIQGTRYCVTPLCNGTQMESKPGWYCPDFGIRQASSVLTLTNGGHQHILGWVIHDSSIPAEWTAQCSSDGWQLRRLEEIVWEQDFGSSSDLAGE